MGKQDMLKMQTYVLRVNIQCVCDGCKEKVKKLIQKTEGVYSTSIDAEQGKVVVSGVVDPEKLINKLKKSGKHAELWGSQKGNSGNGQSYPGNPFHNFGNDRGGKDSKSQPQKGGQGQQKSVPFGSLQMKGAKDFKTPFKDQKSVKFNLEEQEELDDSDEDFDGSEDEEDDFEDELEEDVEEECESGHGFPTGNKMMHFKGNGHDPKGGPKTGMMNGRGHPMTSSKKGGGKDSNVLTRKDGKIDFPFETKSGGGKPQGKNGKEGKNGKGDNSVVGGGKKKKGGKDGGGGGGDKHHGAGKSGGGWLGFLGFGKKSKKGDAGIQKNSKSHGLEHVSGGSGHPKGKKGKTGGEDFDDFPEDDAMSDLLKGGGPGPGGKGGKVGKGGGGGTVGSMGPSSAQMGMMNYPAMGQMGQMGRMGNYPLGPTGDFSSLQGFPPPVAFSGGYDSRGHPLRPPPSYPQSLPPQPQPASYGPAMPHAMMYGRPHPWMNYMPPPPMPSHPMNDPMTHIFSDENTESCGIM